MWNKDFFGKLKNLGVPEHMITRATIGFEARYKPIATLLEQRTLPENGWDDFQIQQFLELLNSMDSDKDPDSIRIGEREARLSTPILYDLCGGFAHGIGRSGNLTAPQPKAAGGSLMQNLTNKLLLSLIRDLGLINIKGALTVPMGTGMSIGLSLRGLLNYYNINLCEKPLVLMTQLDHRSPRKGIEYVGGKILEIPGHFQQYESETREYPAEEGVAINEEELEKMYLQNKDKICAIVSSTAFFAPRLPDNIKFIAKFAKKHNLIHIINNAYGIQVPALLQLIRKGIDAGNVDAIIQSTDKNFLTPVGGATILSPKREIIEAISTCYAGRASASPVIHLLVSLLSMGRNGYRKRIQEQEYNHKVLEEGMKQIANRYNENLILSNNPVSCAMTLSHFSQNQIEKLGGFLYNLRVTGPRIINIAQTAYGSCTNEMPSSYLVMNAAIGSQLEDINQSLIKLTKALQQIQK